MRISNRFYWNRTDWLIEFAFALDKLVPTLHLSNKIWQGPPNHPELEAFYRHWKPIYGKNESLRDIVTHLGATRG